jgi:tRNA(Arg) A34 adenosine deaminase TadA
MTQDDFMREAIRLSRDSIEKRGGGPFGAVVVRRGKIVGRGANRVTATNDPTAHAEITAIRAAGQRLKTFRLDDCEIYTSCEPCPMCLAAIYWAGLTRVYYANTRADAAGVNFRDAWLYRELARPRGRRQIPMQPLLRREALEVFNEWKNKPDKIEY